MGSHASRLSATSAAVLAIVIAGTLAARSAEPPAATPGPPSWEVDLAPAGERGSPFVIEGRVIGTGNRPLRDVLVYAYHADDQGIYMRRGKSQPHLSGMLRTNVMGGYRIRTVLPGLVEGNPHVHFELAGPGAQYRAVALSLCRLVGAGSDTSFAHMPQMLSLPSGSGHWAYARPDTAGGYRCDWDIPFGALQPLSQPPDIFAPHAH